MPKLPNDEKDARQNCHPYIVVYPSRQNLTLRHFVQILTYAIPAAAHFDTIVLTYQSPVLAAHLSRIHATIRLRQ